MDRENGRWEEVDVLLFKGEVMRAIIAERRNHSRLHEAVETVYERCEYLKSTAPELFTVPASRRLPWHHDVNRPSR